MITIRVCWKSIVFANKVGKNSRYFLGILNKKIIPLVLAGYEMIIANSELRASLVTTISSSTRRRRIIVKYLAEILFK